MAAITHVFTIARVAAMLGVDEDRLHEIAIEMEPEDGVMHVYGITPTASWPSPTSASRTSGS